MCRYHFYPHMCDTIFIDLLPLAIYTTAVYTIKYVKYRLDLRNIENAMAKPHTIKWGGRQAIN